MSDEAELDPSLGQTVYQIAGDHILSRQFEDELTLINLQNGDYFAAGGAALPVWKAIEANAAPSRIVETMSACHSGDNAAMAVEIARFCNELLAKGLIVECTAEPATTLADLPAEVTSWPGIWLESYGDMKELLLLDPIHEVGEGAWPPPPTQ
jgi:hypothetical protein